MRYNPATECSIAIILPISSSGLARPNRHAKQRHGVRGHWSQASAFSCHDKAESDLGVHLPRFNDRIPPAPLIKLYLAMRPATGSGFAQMNVALSHAKHLTFINPIALFWTSFDLCGQQDHLNLNRDRSDEGAREVEARLGFQCTPSIRRQWTRVTRSRRSWTWISQNLRPRRQGKAIAPDCRQCL